MADGAAYLDVRGVFKRFRDTRVIENLDLEMRAGEFVSLLGPSGCGPFFTRAIPEGMAMTPSFGAPISTAAPCRLRSAA